MRGAGMSTILYRRLGRTRAVHRWSRWTATAARARRPRSRRGAATLDYVLVLGVILPLAAFVIPISMRMIRAVYEMIVVLISWPFL